MYHESKKYGPVMHFNMAGQHLIVLSSHKAAHDLLSRRGARYSDRPRLVMAFELVTRGMHLLFRPYDDRYKLHQRMESPLFTPRSAAAYRALQEVESRQLVFDLLTDADEHGNKGVDFHHHIERTMASIIYCLNYGYRLQTGHEQELQDAKRVQAEFSRTGLVGEYVVDMLPWLNVLPRFLAPWKREADELFELERRLHVGNLDKALGKKGWNWCKFLKESPEAKLMGKEEFAFDLGILADAALDTSTVALDWFIVAWITNGERWVAKARGLLDEVVGRDRLPSFEDRPKLAYIDAIGESRYPSRSQTPLTETVNETLRWRPVAPGGVPHFTKTADTYMGYTIPANSIVLPNAFAITRDESVFGPDVDSFVPERWLAEEQVPGQEPNIDLAGLNKSALKDLPQAGFGYGRRICAGRFIARNNLFIEMARLLWAFDVLPGVVDESTGERYKVDDMDCTEGFVTLPKLFKAEVRPRGPWARKVISRLGTTHGMDHSAVLEEVREMRA